MMDCFSKEVDHKENSNGDALSYLFQPVPRGSYDVQGYRANQPDLVTVFTFMSINLFNDLQELGSLKPRLGVSCSLMDEGAYKALHRRFGSQFFGWDRDFWSELRDRVTGELEIKEVDNISEDTSVLVEMCIPKEFIMFTNFRNWTDMQCIYGSMDRDPSKLELQEVLDAEFNGLERTLEQLWDDVFYLPEDEQIQLMISEFRRDWIVSSKYVDSRVISY